MIFALLLAVLSAPDTLPRGSLLQREFRDAAGSRPYALYLPAGYDGRTPAPLLVMLHGCMQSADDIAAGTQLNRLADEFGLLVAYPEQPAAEHSQRCWRWYEAAHQERGAGEPAMLAGIAAEVARDQRVDPERVFAAGISAGGAMAVILAATYPDLFRAVGVHSALPYAAARTAAEALGAMREPHIRPDSGRAVLRAMGERARVVRMIVFHGADDPVVQPGNAVALTAQWGGVLRGLPGGSGGRWHAAPAGDARASLRRLATAERQPPLMEVWTITGLGHAWSGGSTEGTFTAPGFPDASRAMLHFFLPR